MIKIKRAEPPECLRKSNDKFTEADYKNPEVRHKLFNMQHGKCCYCERELRELSETEREVDHYTPRTHYYVPPTHRSFKDKRDNILWHLANKWENLLLSCRKCNSVKGKRYPFINKTGEREIIDPSWDNDDPEDHIGFDIKHDVFIRYKANSPLGQSTIDALKFKTRTDLFRSLRKKKNEVEKALIDLFNAIESCDKSQIESKKSELRRATSAHNPFCSFVRKHIQLSLKILNEVWLPELEKEFRKKLKKIKIDFLKGYQVEF